jgi:hypothetical protein
MPIATGNIEHFQTLALVRKFIKQNRPIAAYIQMIDAGTGVRMAGLVALPIGFPACGLPA